MNKELIKIVVEHKEFETHLKAIRNTLAALTAIGFLNGCAGLPPDLNAAMLNAASRTSYYGTQKYNINGHKFTCVSGPYKTTCK